MLFGYRMVADIVICWILAAVTCLVSATVCSTPSFKNTKYMYALGLYESGCRYPYGAGLKYKGDPGHIFFSSGKLSTVREKGERKTGDEIAYKFIFLRNVNFSRVLKNL